MESQQSASSEASAAATEQRARATERSANTAADAERKRRLQALQLQRERVLSERTSSPHRRSALSNALATIEEELAELGWTIHL